jgi:hypothetical protein
MSWLAVEAAAGWPRLWRLLLLLPENTPLDCGLLIHQLATPNAACAAACCYQCVRAGSTVWQTLSWFVNTDTICCRCRAV